MARKPISADSFRKLQALLKKPVVIPEICIPEPKIAFEAEAIVELIVPAVPEVIHVPIAVVPRQTETPLPDREFEFELDSGLPTNDGLKKIASVSEIEIVPVLAPVIEQVAEVLIVPVSVSVIEPSVTAISAQAVNSLSTNGLAASIEPPQAPEEAPRLKTEVAIQTPLPRDAFALPPSAMPVPKSKLIAVPIVQTPQQEQEAAELARSLLDMMASGASSGLPQERALAADTLLRMIPRLPLKSMIMLAERLCMMEAPPHLLVTKLICDPRIEVAGPLLEDCSHITDEDLCLVIQEGDPAKRRMMARRRKVSRAVTNQLVITREASVLLNLVRNQNAEISHESFVQLVHVAAIQEDLLAPLCIRADLPVPFAFELFWPAPAQLRRYLLSRFLTDSETLTKILKIALDTNGDEAAKPENSSPEKIMEALQLADDGAWDEASAIMAAAAQIDAATALRIMSDRQGEPLAALFKAVGITRAASSEILHGLKNSVSGLIDPARDPDELQGLFDSLSFNKARILLTYWDWATLKTGPYAPLN